MSSINDAIHNKAILQSNVLLRILLRILFKDYSGIEYISCVSNILTKISSKDFLP